MFGWALKKILGTKHEREVKRMRPMVAAINNLEIEMKSLSDDALKRKTIEFREQLARGATLNDLIIPSFAVVREASRRVLGMRHFDVQLMGGMVLHGGKISEMKTGEGKTLVATLPCYLNALEGKGVHVVTVNDYLARRDAEWMGKIYQFLGMSVGIVVPQQRDVEKKRAYRCDITYGQNNEIGFDYLRDNMKFSIFDYVQRELNYAIVDEVDSILVDEARTPLIISGPGETASEKYIRINEVIPRLRKDEHYSIDEKHHHVMLTEDGIEAAQRLLHEKGIIQVSNLYDPVNLESLHILHQCLRAHTLYKRDQHYMVAENGQVLIIDEFTGRVLPGRRWSDGLHQAVEAKEHVPIEDENLTLATISFQNLFRLYKKLSGMTGTADTEAEEFHKIYKLDVAVIPTNKPCVRQDYDDVIYRTEKEKFKAVVEEVAELHAEGQPVLLGTTSVEKSDALSRLLTKRNIPHQVLNAKQHEREAYVVAQAGRRGAVTVATNMAGRGTDIVLGGNPEMLAKMEVIDKARAEGVQLDQAAIDAAIAQVRDRYRAECEAEKKEVLSLGGLAIVGTERHESRRIDNQLRGRGGRQGDPGGSRFYLSVDDDLMRIFGGDRLKLMMDRVGMQEDEPIEHKWVTKAVENAQKKVEERNFDIRKNMLEYDDVLNQQRKSIYALRRQVLTGQYRTVPTEEEIKKGIKPQSLVTKANHDLEERARPVLEQIVKLHGSPLPPPDSTQEQLNAHREQAFNASLDRIGTLRPEAIERDVYAWFGCQIDVSDYKDNPKEALEFLDREVGMSLTEQRERILDLADEIVATMVDKTCPPGKHHEDWDLPALTIAYEEQFGIQATGLEKIPDSEELARKLYQDAEAILLRKESDFGADNFLRLFRNLYLEDIDRQWIEHLQAMDHLRDGIGLRGYGQRDPKKEYKREGYDMFTQMMQSIKSSVCAKIFRVERVREEDLERIEDQRRKHAEDRQRRIQASHPDNTEGEGGQSASATSGTQPRATDPGANALRQETVRRDRPKIGRNDPCWCGSGKKYKQCHYREDQQGANI